MIIPHVQQAGLGAIDLSWFNSSLFTKGFYSARSTDEKVDLLNNYWQLLSRAVAAKTQLSTGLRNRLDADMNNWWAWRTSYYDAIFRRAFDPRDLWAGGLQATYERELGGWKNRYLEDMNAIVDAEPAVAEELIRLGVDPDRAFTEFPSGSKDYSLWWGLGAVTLLVGFGAYAAFTSEGYRRSQHDAFDARRAARRSSRRSSGTRKSARPAAKDRFEPRKRSGAGI